MHSPTHLVDFLACKHLSDREREAVAKRMEMECHTPRQMELANAFCRFLEMAEEIG